MAMGQPLDYNQQAVQEKPQIDIDALKSLAIYLEGMYKGQGNLLPLGKIHIENLWITINELQRNKK